MDYVDQGQGQKARISFSSLRGCGSISLMRFTPLITVRPNPSLEARPNIKTPGPRSGLAHFPPRGPGVLLLAPPQLER